MEINIRLVDDQDSENTVKYGLLACNRILS